MPPGIDDVLALCRNVDTFCKVIAVAQIVHDWPWKEEGAGQVSARVCPQAGQHLVYISLAGGRRWRRLRLRGGSSAGVTVSLIGCLLCSGCSGGVTVGVSVIEADPLGGRLTDWPFESSVGRDLLSLNNRRPRETIDPSPLRI